MKGIISSWLNDDLELNLTQDRITSKLKNGVLIAEILHKYKIINDDILYEIQEAVGGKEETLNFMRLRFWMELLGIKFNWDIIHDLLAGRALSGMQVIYQLYSSLSSKAYRKVLGNLNEKQKEYRDWFENNSSRHNNFLCAQNNLKSQGSGVKSLTCKEAVSPRKHSGISRITNIDGQNEEFEFSYYHRNCVEKDKFEPNAIKIDDSKSPNNYIHGIKIKLAKKAGREALKTCLFDNIIDKVWKSVIEKQKILHQPKCSSLLESENAEISNHITSEDREPSIKIDRIKEKDSLNSLTEKLEDQFHLDYESRINLHRKLWNTKIQQQNKCRYRLCRAIFEECSNLAVELSEYASENGVPSKYIDLGFIKEKQPTYQDSESDVSEPHILNLSTRRYQRSKKCCYDEYLYLTGEWFDRELLTVKQKFKNDGDNNNFVLACIIYSLAVGNQLNNKSKSSKLNKYQIACIVNNSPNPSITRKALQALLRKYFILVLDRDTALEYCKGEYMKELDQSPLSKGKSKGKKTAKTEKSSKSANKDQTSLGFKDQEVQVDGIPDTDEIENIEKCIKNGQEVFASLKNKVAVNNDLLARCVVSTIRCQRSMKGWVLINFPSSLEENALFERYISGNTEVSADEKVNGNSEDFKEIPLELSYSSPLIPNVLFEEQKAEPEYSFTKYIEMIVNENRSEEELVEQDNSKHDLSSHFKESNIFQEFKYNKFDRQTIIDLMHSIIDQKMDYDLEKSIVENTQTLDSYFESKPSKNTKKTKKKGTEPECEMFFEKQERTSVDDSVSTKFGDENWKMIDVSLSDANKQLLMELWQLMEESYLNCLKQSFLSFYCIEETVYLYWIYVEEKVKKVSSNNKERDENLKNFIVEYNNKQHSIGPCDKNDNQLSDLETSTLKLLVELWKISDLKRKESGEIISRLLIENGAVFGFLNCLWRVFCILMDMELKRFLDTIFVIQYYYLAALKVENVDCTPLFDEADDEFDKINLSDLENKFIETIILRKSDHIVSTAQRQANVAEKLRKELELNLTAERKSDLQSLVSDRAIALLNEWQIAAEYEMHRLLFRVDLIASRAMHHLTSVQDKAKSLHFDLCSLVEESYLQENHCSTSFAALVDKSKDKKKCLVGSFVFMDNQYHFRGDSITSVTDQSDSSSQYFSLSQLEKMTAHFKTLAPKGTIPRTSLILLLDDWNHDATSERILPNLWCNLSRRQLSDILETITQRDGSIDWKDFLLFGSDLIYPSKEELVIQNRLFLSLDPERSGSISLIDFVKTKLWFENDDPEKKQRIHRLKMFLFWIFKTYEDKFDYRSFLMQLCKDQDPVLGFGKALSILNDRCLIVTDDDRQCRKLVDDFRQCSLKIVSEVLNQVVMDVINLKECALVYEYDDENVEDVPFWKKLGRSPSDAEIEVCKFEKLLPSIIEERRLVERHRQLDWTTHVSTELLVLLLEDGSEVMETQPCFTKKYKPYFLKNCSRLKKSEFVEVSLILEDIFVVEQISEAHRFKTVSLPKIINGILNRVECSCA